MLSIAEIHPMLVHFPIVMWILAESICVAVLLRGGNTSARTQWPMTAFYALAAGVVFASLAAVFGDIALDKAVTAGFDAAPIERHETLALATLGIFSLHALLRFLAIRRRYALSAFRGWLAELPGLLGIFLLIYTAYLGGHLVYHLGVNVAAVAH